MQENHTVHCALDDESLENSGNDVEPPVKRKRILENVILPGGMDLNNDT